MLELTINGVPKSLDGVTTLAQVLAELGHVGSGFAVAVDGDFVARSSYTSYSLKGGEALEILSPMQGG